MVSQRRECSNGHTVEPCGEGTDIVDENVDLPQLLGDPLEESLDGRSVAHVQSKRDELSTFACRTFFVGLLCEFGYLIESLLTACSQDEVGACAGEENSLQETVAGDGVSIVGCGGGNRGFLNQDGNGLQSRLRFLLMLQSREVGRGCVSLGRQGEEAQVENRDRNIPRGQFCRPVEMPRIRQTLFEI